MTSAAAAPVVELNDVSKTFGEATVLDDLTMSVGPGQIYGLIGPSGCGKTTTIRLLVGVLAPTSGSVRVLGADPAHFTTRHREQIGYTPQGFYLYPTLTVAENARFVASLFGVPFRRRGRRVREMLQFLELWDARKRLARDISGGMQRRLELACALLHDPTLLFVDEPTAGLDPVLREKIWGHLRKLVDEGRTVFVTTQYIDEASYCDMVAVMNQGRLAALGTPDELRQMALRHPELEVEAEQPLTADDIAALEALPGVRFVDDWNSTPTHLRLRVRDLAVATPVVTEALNQRGTRFTSVRPYEPSFDEAFRMIVEEHSQKWEAEQRQAQDGAAQQRLSRVGT